MLCAGNVFHVLVRLDNALYLIVAFFYHLVQALYFPFRQFYDCMYALWLLGCLGRCGLLLGKSGLGLLAAFDEAAAVVYHLLKLRNGFGVRRELNQLALVLGGILCDVPGVGLVILSTPEARRPADLDGTFPPHVESLVVQIRADLTVIAARSLHTEHTVVVDVFLALLALFSDP